MKEVYICNKERLKDYIEHAVFKGVEYAAQHKYSYINLDDYKQITANKIIRAIEGETISSESLTSLLKKYKESNKAEEERMVQENELLKQIAEAMENIVKALEREETK